jgi:hypothetical protein
VCVAGGGGVGLQEFLKKGQASLSAYSKGVENAVRYLGPDHGITVTLKKSEVAARAALEAAGRRRDKALASSRALRGAPRWFPCLRCATETLGMMLGVARWAKRLSMA